MLINELIQAIVERTGMRAPNLKKICKELRRCDHKSGHKTYKV